MMSGVREGSKQHRPPHLHPPEKTTLKKLNLIRVNDFLLLYLSLCLPLGSAEYSLYTLHISRDEDVFVNTIVFFPYTCLI